MQFQLFTIEVVGVPVHVFVLVDVLSSSQAAQLTDVITNSPMRVASTVDDSFKEVFTAHVKASNKKACVFNIGVNAHFQPVMNEISKLNVEG